MDLLGNLHRFFLGLYPGFGGFKWDDPYTLKINTEHNHGGLEDHFSFLNG